MGGSYSKNVLDDSISIYFQELITITQNCSNQMTAEQRVNVVDARNVFIDGVNFVQWFSVDTMCVQRADADTTVRNRLEMKLQQIATAINQAIDANPGSTKAENIIKLMTSIGTQIREQFAQNCNATLNGQQAVNVVGSDNVVILFVNFSQTMDAVRTCVMNTITKTSDYNQLIQEISQTAKAVVQSLLSGLGLLLVLVLVIAIAVMWSSGIQGLLNPLFLSGIGLAVLAFLVLEYFVQWWPYSRIYANDSAEEKASKAAWNRTLLFIVLGMAVVTGIVFYFLARRSGGATAVAVATAS